MSIRIEVFSTSGCSHCERSRDSLKAIAQAFAQRVTWRDVNLLDELDYAVRLGVLTPPSMAIDGELVFPKLPSAAQLHDELARRLERERM
ncbi:MAG: glutaredoxin [Rhodanobacter sp. 67-28]|uniref:thioredoxin family protein n=1 Tax=Rhodanobacter sp. FW021-MT20 TaxID=1162282 RepID=UPI000260DFDC|nr:thioredoxin family protein [Rhodanobacter sp. 115]EIL86813.1 thioredoxin/glutaredoxin [Rhodanobacter sp. 115]ODT95127.1 MAG: thioredoxin [Rhodanobacter sp. SCN 67-45]OJW45470.1 MAG: glutaredoxin [Rhodanobacter sp. 67-28]TAM41260.1 MAG: glutaredoxin [Rhodanobacter sp.]